MATRSLALLGVLVSILCAMPCYSQASSTLIPGAAPPEAPPPQNVQPTIGPESADGKTPEGESVDLQNEDTFIDISDALRSKQYVHRAILNSLVTETNRFGVGRFYVAHMMGFNQVWQRRKDFYSKYASGLQGISAGYISKWGHGLELGGELSSVTNVFLSYKYFLRPSKFSLWGVFGGGIGTEVTAINFAEGPPEEALYTGSRQMVFVSLGVLVPMIDVGFKGEVRINFYGGDRFIFTSGIGVILFL
jgi:hypothetical protein